MANTIDISYFFGSLLIAQKSSTSVSSSLTASIDKLEPQLLTSLLGYELYKAYLAGIAVVSPDAKWTAIKNGKEYTNRKGINTKWMGLSFTEGTLKRSFIANYVYWHWLGNEFSATTGSGETQPNNPNAKTVSPIRKQVAAWNEMVDMVWEFIEFLLSNQSDYPEFLTHYSNGLFYTNNAGRLVKNKILYKQNYLGF